MKLFRSILVCLFLTIALSTNALAAPLSQTSTIYYVKSIPTGPSCTSWDDACGLQAALTKATAGSQIWVAKGTYYPTTSSSDRSATFRLKSGVGIFGGFPENGGAWIERNWVTNVTTLSGDIGEPGASEDNSYHVLTADDNVAASAILDGFTITGGMADSNVEPNCYGGGMYNYLSSPTLTNLTFSGNSTDYDGGGMYNYSSSPTLTNLAFNSNSAWFGGGMYNTGISNPTLTNVTFSDNSAIGGLGGGMANFNESNPSLINVDFSGNSADDGGGMYNESSSPILTNVTFSDNSANNGGGMNNSYGSSPTLTNVNFSGNSADNGGGMHNYYNSNPSLINVTFSSNLAGTDGGGMYNDSGSSPTLTSVTFSDNSADNGNGGGIYNGGSPILTIVTFSGNSAASGGGMYNSGIGSNPTLTNVTFSGNSATSGGGMTNFYYSDTSLINVTFSGNSADLDGGGIYNGGSSLELTNVTFSGNSALAIDGVGGGIYNDEESYAKLINVIVWGNNPSNNQIVGPAEDGDGIGVVVTYSIIQGWPSGGTGNISTNPELGTLADNGGFTQTHALGAISPAIDAGDPDSCPNYDQRGYLRPFDGDADSEAICDMGAYEYASTPASFTLTVNKVGNGSVTPPPNAAGYLYGQLVTLIATADPGYTFAGWNGDEFNTINPLNFIILEDTTITATFTQDEYTLGVALVGSGTVTKAPDQPTYHYGDVVTLTPTAQPGWTFKDWTGATVTNNKVTINGNTSITATFTQDEYTFGVALVGSGTVTKDPDQPTYHYGDVVTLTPTANLGWTFKDWTGATVTDNKVTINGNTNLTAAFTQDDYTLGVTLVGSGTVTKDPDQPTYHYGDVVTLTPTAATGWTFKNWTGATVTDNKVTITGNTSLTATFTQDEYTLGVVLVGSGTVTKDPDQPTYYYGDVVILTPTAATGWTFKDWTGATVTGNKVTINGNTSITATFTQDEYTLVVTLVGSGTVTKAPDQPTYHYGDVVTLTPTAATGWTFKNWTGATVTDNKVTINGTTSITAIFTQSLFKVYLPSVLK